jgi:hypothetical protein
MVDAWRRRCSARNRRSGEPCKQWAIHGGWVEVLRAATLISECRARGVPVLDYAAAVVPSGWPACR